MLNHRVTQEKSAREITCSKFVVVIGSERFKLEINGSTSVRCNCSRNIVESKIFTTVQTVPCFMSPLFMMQNNQCFTGFSIGAEAIMSPKLCFGGPART
jgi:hypothetical protein